RSPDEAEDGLDREPRGDFAGAVPTHPIGDGKEPNVRVGNELILVRFPDTPGIRYTTSLYHWRHSERVDRGDAESRQYHFCLLLTGAMRYCLPRLLPMSQPAVMILSPPLRFRAKRTLDAHCPDPDQPGTAPDQRRQRALGS